MKGSKDGFNTRPTSGGAYELDGRVYGVVKYGEDKELERLAEQWAGRLKQASDLEVNECQWRKLDIDGISQRNDQTPRVSQPEAVYQKRNAKLIIMSHVEQQVNAFMSKNTDKVTEKQLQAYQLWIDGKSMKDIGKVMGVSHQAVSKHLTALFNKVELMLEVGLFLDCQILKNFMHPSVLTLRESRERWKLVKKSEEYRYTYTLLVHRVGKRNLGYGCSQAQLDYALNSRERLRVTINNNSKATITNRSEMGGFLIAKNEEEKK